VVLKYLTLGTKQFNFIVKHRWQKMGSGVLQKNIDGLQIGGTG
jgi:hypothetical protein